MKVIRSFMLYMMCVATFGMPSIAWSDWWSEDFAWDANPEAVYDIHDLNTEELRVDKLLKFVFALAYYDYNYNLANQAMSDPSINVRLEPRPYHNHRPVEHVLQGSGVVTGLLMRKKFSTYRKVPIIGSALMAASVASAAYMLVHDMNVHLQKTYKFDAVQTTVVFSTFLGVKKRCSISLAPIPKQRRDTKVKYQAYYRISHCKNKGSLSRGLITVGREEDDGTISPVELEVHGLDYVFMPEHQKFGRSGKL